ncbi:MAG: winged helix-turn-helix transcriptional regulator [Betaproteobacteria bacterium]|jgi:ArsR family transcriptional regulator|uniref:Putative regulatory protein SoxR of the ArsR/SmtB family n=1 Tax=Thiomonas delicata TaxID=364030 RepID=A0A238D4H2_THIDL|nr:MULTISPECIES: metalloregulator ArsR/SmtB family transcription factor [Thiomonas]MDE2129576.1 winged helix-turn-helix transcriptional regulator [Betaproteobacteria bacterium]OZB45684.1 MAG: transcriptional regulator [Thiomonas sp. 15-66-11]OZB63006.1 MAG: transcriptional regulator [Thiomonas sp. 13-66-29]SBP88193.1 putative regulatory protein SoxR of the ArsR/SmtB family [Thiomonas delicata]
MTAQLTSLPLLNTDAEDDEDAERVFILAAELFGVLATPLRLRILNAICNQERGVGEIMEVVESTQPNVSQHLKVLYQAGIVAKRRVGNQVYYRVQSEKAVQLCRTVCTQIAIELDDPESVSQSERLARRI